MRALCSTKLHIWHPLMVIVGNQFAYELHTVQFNFYDYIYFMQRYFFITAPFLLTNYLTKVGSIFDKNVFKFWWKQLKLLRLFQWKQTCTRPISRSAHQTPNLTNPEFQFPQFQMLQSVFILVCVKSYIGIFWCILVLI